MNVVCAGLNHHVAPVEIRERLAVPPHRMPSVLTELQAVDGIEEAVIISTCNRVEYYAASEHPELALAGLRSFIESRATATATLYHHTGPSSIRHLFRVACGLDSMVIGETEILGQIKTAYAAAASHGTTRRTLNKLFQHAFRVAKNVRTDTQITRGSTSVGAVAVELAGKIFGDLDHRRVMILGAGDTSERTARALVSRGVRTVIVSNRTYERAARLAADIGGMAIHFDHWHKEFSDVDILISSTGAPAAILTREKIDPVIRQRRGRPLFLIDLAVPRDIEPSVNELDGIFLYDIDSLEQIANRSLANRRQEIEHCERIIDSHVESFLQTIAARPTSPPARPSTPPPDTAIRRST
ncbi:MAG: glutamyl-tRNA reductase [Chthoniobacterales bacterium]